MVHHPYFNIWGNNISLSADTASPFVLRLQRSSVKGDVIQLACYRYFLLFLLIWYRFATCLHIIDHFVMERREDGYLISLFPHTQSHFPGFIQIREETARKLHCSCQLPPAKKINKKPHTFPHQKTQFWKFSTYFLFFLYRGFCFSFIFHIKMVPKCLPFKTRVAIC